MIVALQGGLANQLFQAAFGLSVSKARNEEVLFTKFRVDQDYKRSYSLAPFNMDLKFVSHETQPYYTEGGPRFDANVYNAPVGSTYAGYWQNERYFDVPLVRQAVSLRRLPSKETLDTEQAMRNPSSVFIHVRRGDYVIESHTRSFHGNMGMEYYNEAIEYIRSRVENPKFFVFSDDPDWCRVQFPNEFVIVDHNKAGNGQAPGREHEDLWLMWKCRHAIIANSAFSWWGAWGGDISSRLDRIVVAPKQWFRDPNMQNNDIVPDRWIKI